MAGHWVRCLGCSGGLRVAQESRVTASGFLAPVATGSCCFYSSVFQHAVLSRAVEMKSYEIQAYLICLAGYTCNNFSKNEAETLVIQLDSCSVRRDLWLLLLLLFAFQVTLPNNSIYLVRHLQITWARYCTNTWKIAPAPNSLHKFHRPTSLKKLSETFLE